ncbi:EAL domain-containing protein [Herbaspirillum sp. AP21]|uniref:sensor domain-containing phosphodiesterase n=1 Tax=unclassified Herbaspirillum TaxID=2624150 RepID=UPI00351A3F64
MLLENEEAVEQEPASHRERQRLVQLKSYCVLDSLPDKQCDQVTELARSLFGVDIALVSLIDEHRQWFKSRAGLDVSETPRSDSFCNHAIEISGGMVVLDAQEDVRFAGNALVTGAPHIRFYAGAPLVTSRGLSLGTLCIIDSRPRSEFGANQLAQLQQLAAIVMERLEQLRNRGYIDHVTTLPNRARLMEVLRTRRHEATSLPCAALAVDICPREYLFDMVKALGWDYVEGFLMEVSRTLRQVLAGIEVYRVTTTTFVYLDDSDPVTRRRHIADLQQRFFQVLEFQGIPHRLAIAIGVLPALDEISGNDVVRSLLTVIDVSREEAISPRIFESAHAENQRYAFWLLSALPMALNTPGELMLHYQPKVRLCDGACVGVEALIRWHHPIQGSISPETFIALAEKTGQIRQITAWVLREAVMQVARWLAQGRSLPVAINTSARDFDSDELYHQLSALLIQHKVPAELIEIEFTEHAMANNPELVRQRVLAIQKLGVKVALDDFGAGFSNLAYLKNIPADSMKIDRSFICRLLDDQVDQLIVPAIIHLAHNLGFSVVAEGLENERTAKILRHLGCDYAQGYAIARPMPVEDLEEWMQTRWCEVFNVLPSNAVSLP